MAENGLRVVLAKNKWQAKTGREGMLGTIVDMHQNHSGKTAIVIWDNGLRSSYSIERPEGNQIVAIEAKRNGKSRS